VIRSTNDRKTAALWRAELSAGQLPQNAENMPDSERGSSTCAQLSPFVGTATADVDGRRQFLAKKVT
jgi:hypothetical protein